MGQIARYIDWLPDEAKDRIIEAQDWCRGTYVTSDGRRCMLGWAEGWSNNGGVADIALYYRRMDYENNLYGRHRRILYGAFDRLTRRFGLERVVRAIKLRAGRQNRLVTTELPTPAEAKLSKALP